MRTTPHQAKALCSAISSSLVRVSSGSNTRRATQHLASFAGYMSKTDVETFEDAEKDISVKLDTLVSRCIKIGLLLPSVPCIHNCIAFTHAHISLCMICSGCVADLDQ